MNNGTRIRTVLAIATSLNTALMATDITGFHNPTIDTIYKVVSIILNFVIVACVTYYNNDFTEEADYHTTIMRLEKAKEDLPEDYWNDDAPIEDEETDEEDGGEGDGELDG